MASPAAFDLVELQDELKANVVCFPMQAARWLGFAGVASYTWTRVKFEAASASTVPSHEKGLYCFVVEPEIASIPVHGFLMYVGKVEKATRSFRDRFYEYLSEPNKKKPTRPGIVRLIRKFPDHLYFYYAPMPPEANIASEEDQLIQATLPPVNENVPAAVKGVVRAF